MCEPFRVEDAAADHTICLTFSDAIPKPPQGAAQKRAGLSLAGRRRAAPAAALQRGGQNAAVHLRRDARRAHGCDLRRELSRGGVGARRAGGGGAVRHLRRRRNAGAAQLVYRDAHGEGILFSGPSGIGKSTQAALWERFAGARTINGDRGLVCPAARTVSGIFYAGTSGICQNVTAPLRAVVLLGQAAENRVVRARPQEAFCAAAEPVRLLRVGRRVRRADDGAGGAARDERARLADGLPGG